MEFSCLIISLLFLISELQLQLPGKHSHSLIINKHWFLTLIENHFYGTYEIGNWSFTFRNLRLKKTSIRGSKLKSTSIYTTTRQFLNFYITTIITSFLFFYLHTEICWRLFLPKELSACTHFQHQVIYLCISEPLSSNWYYLNVCDVKSIEEKCTANFVCMAQTWNC